MTKKVTTYGTREATRYDLIHRFLYSACKSFVEAFWTPASLVIPVYLAIVAPLIWQLGHQQLDDRSLMSSYYLLSSQAQVLGAIVALVFTTTVVTAQLVSRYSQRVLRQVFGPWALYYLILYLVGIILPLFLLGSGFRLLHVRISLLLGGLCLVLLVPYFVVVRRRLSIETLVRSVEEDAWKYPAESVSVLENLAMGALSSHDYETFSNTLQALQRIGKSFALAKARQWREIVISLASKFGDIARRTLRDPKAPFEAVSILQELAKAVAVAEAKSAAISAAGPLSKVGCEAGRPELPELAESNADVPELAAEEVESASATLASVGILGKVGREAIRQELPDLAEWVAGALGMVGKATVQAHLRKEARRTVRILKEIGESSAQRSFPNSVEQASLALLVVGTAAVQATKSEEPHAKSTLRDVALDAAEALGYVGSAAVRNLGEEVCNAIVNRLAQMGREAALAPVVPVVHRVVNGLWQMWEAARNRDQEGVTKGVTRSVAWAFGRVFEAICSERV